MRDSSQKVTTTAEGTSRAISDMKLSKRFDVVYQKIHQTKFVRESSQDIHSYNQSELEFAKEKK